MNYQRIEQMSSQIYNKCGYYPHYVGHNRKSIYIRDILSYISSSSCQAILQWTYQYDLQARITKQDLCLQTLFTIQSNHLARVTKELKHHNIALRLSGNTFVVSLDYISAFSLPQRQRYVDIITRYECYDPQMPKADVDLSTDMNSL